MVFITEELVRKRAEHNDREIFSLEELSLHQCDVERIEHLDRWCREIRILYLQSNLISRIENVGRLKKLEYLNLAINSIERVENLAGCESLVKLDLTLNFIGEITSLASLAVNERLEQLFLTGNPCADFQHYRDWLVLQLPQLQSLDGRVVTRQERITAAQHAELVHKSVLDEQRQYASKRAGQKERNASSNTPTVGRQHSDDAGQKDVREQHQEEEEERRFWHEKTEYTPESRCQVHDHMQASRQRRKEHDEKRTNHFEDAGTKQRVWRLQDSSGRDLNVNPDRLPFELDADSDETQLRLRIAVFRHLDTERINVDVHPWRVTASIDGRPFQLVLPVEVRPDSSHVQRSSTTGHLLVCMPKLEVPKMKTVPFVRPAAVEPNPVSVGDGIHRENARINTAREIYQDMPDLE